MAYENFEKTVTALSEAKTYQDVIAVMKTSFAELGFPEWIYLFHSLESYANVPAICFFNVPQEWVLHYLQMNYYHVDPLASYYIKNNLPLLWDAQADWSKTGPEAVAFMEDLHSYGFTGGLFVPLFSAQNTRGFINLVTRTSDLGHLREALQGRAGQVVFLMRYVHEAVLRIALENGDSLYLNPLTPRQKEILLWVGEGLTSKAIAARLGMSYRTVEHHLAEIQRKLNVSNRQQAVTKAINLGFVLPINTPKDPVVTLIY